MGRRSQTGAPCDKGVGGDVRTGPNLRAERRELTCPATIPYNPRASASNNLEQAARGARPPIHLK